MTFDHRSSGPLSTKCSTASSMSSSQRVGTSQSRVSSSLSQKPLPVRWARRPNATRTSSEPRSTISILSSSPCRPSSTGITVKRMDRLKHWPTQELRSRVHRRLAEPYSSTWSSQLPNSIYQLLVKQVMPPRLPLLESPLRLVTTATSHRHD